MENNFRLSRFTDLISLTALIVGIASVVALLSVIEVEKVEVTRKFERIGVNSIVFKFNLDKNRPAISLAKAATVKEVVPGLEMATPLVVEQGSLTLRKGKANIQVVGVNADFFPINGLEAGGGRLLSDLDGAVLRCVLGANVMKTLAKSGEAVKPGSTLQIGSSNFMVVGSLKPVSGMAPPVSVDDVIFIHSETAQEIFKNVNVDLFQARVYKGVDIEVAISGILQSLGVDKNRAATVVATSGEEIMSTMRGWGRLFILFFGLVGSVTLVLGGIRFMSFLMRRVDKRKVEIIVKKALGTKGADIQMSYLLEALLLSFLTGVAGAALGVAFARLACAIADWRFFVTGDPIFIGIGISVIFGLLLGTYPAIHASHLDIAKAVKQ